jgi:thiol-disulfide isomerase/thioredoxin
MSKRNTYLAGGAAVAIGIAMIVIALVALSGDDSGDVSTTAPHSASTGATGAQAPSGRPAAKPSAPAGARGSVEDELDQSGKAKAPAFSLSVVDEGSAPSPVRKQIGKATAGGSLGLSGLSGTPVVLYMYSSGCGPCRADARLVQATWERWGRRDVAFVGVGVKDSEQAVRSFARQYKLTYPNVRDGDGRVAAAYGAKVLPEVFFISGSGDVVGHVAGSPSVRQMEFGTASARSGRSFGNEEGGSRQPLG